MRAAAETCRQASVAASAVHVESHTGTLRGKRRTLAVEGASPEAPGQPIPLRMLLHSVYPPCHGSTPFGGHSGHVCAVGVQKERLKTVAMSRSILRSKKFV